MFDEDRDALLSQLEQIELRWLSWGRVDGSLQAAEVEELAATIAGDSARGERLIDDLLDENLLCDIGDAEPRYRTRFAESVRLLVRNRQLLHGQDWRASAQLVDDFRVIAGPRVPRRDVTVETVIERLGAQRTMAPVERQALEGMLTGPDGALRLSQFQVDALLHIRSALNSAASSATIVGAGTGSGKTKAFYLPALAHVAADGDPSAWARIIALYPRNELLKDQFAEALGQVDAMPPPAARSDAGRSIRAHGRTARSPGTRMETQGVEGDRRRVRVSLCALPAAWMQRKPCVAPRCLGEGRGGAPGADRARGDRAAAKSSDEGGDRDRPPHVLFTTTEMLNRGLADGEYRPVYIGATAASGRDMLLLDEVHTYGGAHGAQVALLLRRWQHALGRNPALHIVGLSATLEKPRSSCGPDRSERGRRDPTARRGPRCVGCRVRNRSSRESGFRDSASLDDNSDRVPRRATARVATIRNRAVRAAAEFRVHR